MAHLLIIVRCACDREFRKWHEGEWYCAILEVGDELDGNRMRFVLDCRYQQKSSEARGPSYEVQGSAKSIGER